MTIIEPTNITNPGSIPPYVYGYQPYTNITPFTYRDGATFLEIFEGAILYLNGTVIPFINNNFSEFDDEFTADMNTLIAQVNQQIADLTKYVNDSMDAVLNDSIQLQDSVMYGILNDPTSQSAPQIHAMFKSDAKARGVINAADYGATKNLATLNAAIAAAEARGAHTKLYVPAGIWDVGNGLSLSGKSVVIIGDGIGGLNEANPTGTVFFASTQNGPVIDFTGWLIPVPGFDGKVTFQGFLVQGSNVADPTLNNSGLKFSALTSATFSDIAIRHTGGPCIDMAANPGNAVYLCDFERMILQEPVAMATNNVPFFRANECNGNHFSRFGLHSRGNTIAAVGAIQILSNASYSATDNFFDAWWFENLIVPTNGTIVAHAGNNDVFSDFQFFDCFKIAGSTGTCAFRLTAPANSKNYGSNLVTGIIPGGGGATDLDIGVDMRQFRNRVAGLKSYRAFAGSNVVIAAGVLSTYVELAGTYSPGYPAVIDNSGNQTNIVKDTTALQYPEGGTGFRRIQATRFYGAADNVAATAVMTDGTALAVPFWLPVAATFTNIYCQVTAGAVGALLRLGIYANDPSKDIPAALVLDAGTVDGAAAGVKSIANTFLLQAGLYWLVMAPQGGAPTVVSIGNGLAPVSGTIGAPMMTPNCYFMAAVTAALPTTWTSVANPAANAPKIMLRAQ